MGFNYFKVSEDLLNTDIKKSELWVYLTHCRSKGIRSKGYSIASLHAVTKTFGNTINRKAYDKAIDSLIDKGLIQIAEEEVKPGWYKSDKAIKIVEGKRNIQIPINLLDKKIITKFSVKEIKDIIRLYRLYDPLGSFGGLDYNLIYAINDKNSNGITNTFTFGGGFSRVIKGKKAFKVEDPKTYINNTKNEIDLNKYILMKLFKLKPVILEYDIEDEELTELKSEVFEHLVKGDKEELKHKYIITGLEDNQKIIWILEPLYPVKNEVYTEYSKNRAKAREKAVEIFGHDEATTEATLRRLIYDGQIYNFVADHLMNRSDIEGDKILELLLKIDIYSDDSIRTLEEELSLIMYEVSNEEASIRIENADITRATGKKRRHTTSDRLKQLNQEASNISNKIKNLEFIEGEVKELVPQWIINEIVDTENRDYSDI